MEDIKRNLFSDFSPVSKQEWKRFVLEKYKINPETLIWNTLEGFFADPYQDETSTPDVRQPLFRSKHTVFVEPVFASGPAAARNFHKKKIPLLSADFRYNTGESCWESAGISPAPGLPKFRKWIQDTGKNQPVFVDFGAAGPIAYSLADKRKHVYLLYDPFTEMLKTGRVGMDEKPLAELISELAKSGKKTLCVHGSFYEQAGATIVQQAAFITAIIAELLAFAPENEKKHVAKAIMIRVASGPLYFPEIAKLRALHILWKHLLPAFGLPPDIELCLFAETSSVYKSAGDTENNLIRNALESLASVAGGADYLMIHPHDASAKEPGSFSQRMAENIHHILKEEVHANFVADPAAGSWYIETLTDSIAEGAWKLFQEIEAEGGFLAALKAGTIQQRIHESAEKKRQEFSAGKRKLVGVNIFPSEKPEKISIRQQEAYIKLSSSGNPVSAEHGKKRLSAWAAALQKGAAIADLLQAEFSSGQKIMRVHTLNFSAEPAGKTTKQGDEQ